MLYFIKKYFTYFTFSLTIKAGRDLFGLSKILVNDDETGFCQNIKALL